MECRQEHAVSWIQLVKQLTVIASTLLARANPNIPNYNKKIAFYVLVLISFTSASTWKITKSKVGLLME